MTMRKKIALSAFIIIAVAVITAAAIAAAPFIISVINTQSIELIYRNKWGLDISGAVMMYEAPVEESFFGEGVRYRVFDISTVNNADRAFGLLRG